MKYVALLRGINVGGNRKVDMKQLKAVFEAAGMHDVRTYINSGNVLFSSEAAHPARLSKKLEKAIESEFGFPVLVLLRSSDEIRATLDMLPDKWANDESSKCDVIFLSEELDSPDVLDELDIKPDIDYVVYTPGAVLWHVERKNATRSGLLKIVGTEFYARTSVRNCNTLRKLAAMME